MHRVETQTDDSRRAKRFVALRAQENRAVLTGAAKRHSFPLAAGLAIAALTVCSFAATVEPPLAYRTLNFGTTGTFLTGIRGNNIFGNYVIPGTGGDTGGLLYSLSTGIWTPFPLPTETAPTFLEPSDPRLMAPALVPRTAF